MNKNTHILLFIMYTVAKLYMQSKGFKESQTRTLNIISPSPIPDSPQLNSPCWAACFVVMAPAAQFGRVLLRCDSTVHFRHKLSRSHTSLSLKYSPSFVGLQGVAGSFGCFSLRLIIFIFSIISLVSTRSSESREELETVRESIGAVKSVSGGWSKTSWEVPLLTFYLLPITAELQYVWKSRPRYHMLARASRSLQYNSENFVVAKLKDLFKRGLIHTQQLQRYGNMNCYHPLGRVNGNQISSLRHFRWVTLSHTQTHTHQTQWVMVIAVA